MDDFLNEGKEKKSTNKIFLVAALLGVLVLVGGIAAIFLMPEQKIQKQVELEGAFREGSPEFENITKDIIIITDMNSMKESQTRLGDVIMTMSGKILNKSDKVITALEVDAGMVDSKNEIIKQKKFLVIPQKEKITLGPDEAIDVSINLSGFRNNDDRTNARWKVTAIKVR